MLTLEAPNSVISEIQRLSEGMDVEVSEAHDSELAAIAMDSPLSGEDIQLALQTLTVLFKTATAGVGFLTAVRAYLKKRPEEKVKVYNDKGEEIGSVNGASTDEELKKLSPSN